MTLATLAAGADGAMVEMHPDPKNAMSDGSQALTVEQFAALMAEVKRLAGVFGRES